MTKISGKSDNVPVCAAPTKPGAQQRGGGHCVSSASTHGPQSWLLISNPLVPDFVVKDPKQSPVWEITGAEFSKSTTHTADGISIRFPRVTRYDT
jgi:hypothetical protein